MMGAQIGVYCVIENDVEIGPGVVIGDGTHIGSGAQLHHPAVIGREVFVAPMVFLSNDKYPSLAGRFEPMGVVVQDHAIIGAGAILSGGVTIGEGAFVAAGSIVTKDVERGGMVRGNGTAAQGYKDRPMHYPGSAVEHWGPICQEQWCEACEKCGIEQYEAFRERMVNHA